MKETAATPANGYLTFPAIRAVGRPLDSVLIEACTCANAAIGTRVSYLEEHEAGVELERQGTVIGFPGEYAWAGCTVRWDDDGSEDHIEPEDLTVIAVPDRAS